MAHRRIGQVLVDMGFITDEQQELLVDEQREHPGQLLGKVAIDMGLIHEDLLVQDELRTFLGFNIRVVVSSESAMTSALERYYGESNESVESIVLALEE